MGDLRSFFSDEDEELILTAIREAETNTSGEIRVHIEKTAGEDHMVIARKAFVDLGMRNTELHNGVLFFLAIEDRRFVILGDDGINEKVPDDFWDAVRDAVITEFKQERFAQGLSEGIKLAGVQLAKFFPYQKGDDNELPDAISYADEKAQGENK